MYYRRLLSILISVTSASHAWADKTPLLLSCNGAPETDPAIVVSLCDALAEELDERKPGRVIRRNAAPDPLPKRAWDVVLEVTRTEDYHWEARLAWTKTKRMTNRQDSRFARRQPPAGLHPGKDAMTNRQDSRFARRQPPAGLHPGKDAMTDAERTTGPEVEIFGMDAPLGQGAYPHFARSLLKVSKPEFLASPRGGRTPVAAVKGRCPRPLDEGDR